jgi:CRISPR-associated protein (TIGR02584 family)
LSWSTIGSQGSNASKEGVAYAFGKKSFDADNIHVIKRPNGELLRDIRTDADNVAFADFITEQVREITADPATILHISIAGGRKTMGFYAGYALSLFGRAQDHLSHVLVSPSFESLKEFSIRVPTPRSFATAGAAP